MWTVLAGDLTLEIKNRIDMIGSQWHQLSYFVANKKKKLLLKPLKTAYLALGFLNKLNLQRNLL